ncbi:ABC transporter permease [Streptacidiphilus sp. PAMC 29251]
MTTAVLNTPRRQQKQPEQPAFGNLLRSEWTKLTSLRSTWWSLTAMVVLSIGFTVAATSLLTANWNTLSPDNQDQYVHDTIGLILQPGAQWGQLAACVLGVLLFASEFSTGMIRSTLLAAPRRTPVLAAKATVFAGVLFVLAELIAVPSFLIGSRITSAHAHTSLTDPTTLRALAAFGLYIALTGVFALCLGALIRHPAGAISAVLGLQFVLPAVTSLLPGSLGEHVSGALPASTIVMMGSGHNSSDAYSPLQGLLIMLGWVLAAYLAARLTLRKRDV